MPVTDDMVMEALSVVQDPELRMGIVEMGLIYGVDVRDSGQTVEVRMTLTTPGCPYGPALIDGVKLVVEQLPGVQNADVKMVWEPPWNPEQMASDEVKDKLGIW
jgi:metal-sulfur cluster biosynthetic enzyme